MGYSGYLDNESKNILLEYQNVLIEKDECFLDLFYRLLEEQAVNAPTPLTAGTEGYTDADIQQWSWNDIWDNPLFIGIKILEPTGILTWPDVYQDWKAVADLPDNSPLLVRWPAKALALLTTFSALPNLPGLQIGTRLAAKGMREGIKLGLKTSPRIVYEYLRGALIKLTKDPKNQEDIVKFITGLLERPDVKSNATIVKYLQNVRECVQTRSLKPLGITDEVIKASDELAIEKTGQGITIGPKSPSAAAKLNEIEKTASWKEFERAQRGIKTGPQPTVAPQDTVQAGTRGAMTAAAPPKQSTGSKALQVAKKAGWYGLGAKQAVAKGAIQGGREAGQWYYDKPGQSPFASTTQKSFQGNINAPTATDQIMKQYNIKGW